MTGEEELKFLAEEMRRSVAPAPPEEQCGAPTGDGRACVLSKGHYGFVGHWSAENLEREKHWPCVRDKLPCGDPKCVRLEHIEQEKSR